MSENDLENNPNPVPDNNDNGENNSFEEEEKQQANASSEQNPAEGKEEALMQPHNPGPEGSEPDLSIEHHESNKEEDEEQSHYSEEEPSSGVIEDEEDFDEDEEDEEDDEEEEDEEEEDEEEEDEEEEEIKENEPFETKELKPEPKIKEAQYLSLEIEGQKPEMEPLIAKPVIQKRMLAFTQAPAIAQEPSQQQPQALKKKLVIQEKPSFKDYDFGSDELGVGLLKDSTLSKAQVTEGFCSQTAKWLKSWCKSKPRDPKAEKPAETSSKKTNEVEKQFKNRVIVRYLFVVLIPIVLLSIFFALYFFTKSEGGFAYVVRQSATVNVNVTGCLLKINQNPQENMVSGTYYVTYSLSALYNETLAQSSAEIFFDEDNNTLNISVTSAQKNLKSCRLELNLPTNTDLIDKLHIECFDKCFITQEYNTLQVNALEILSEDDVYTNFRRIEAESLNYTADKGILQMNSFLIAKQAEINLKYGDVILQTERDLSLIWYNEQQTYCFASPFVQHESIENCHEAENPNTADKATATNCHGQTFVCEKNTCTASLATFTVKQILGNLFVNRIETPFIDIDYNYQGNYNVKKGAVYENGPAFEPFVLAGVEEMKANAKEMSTDAIFILQLGKKYLQSQGNSFWTVISNPSFAYIRPWWLATFSLSLLTANSYEISGYLSPGLCPYHIEYDRYDIYQVQSYLSSYFELNNSVISYIDEAFQAPPDYQHKNGTGFYDFEQDKPVSEKWFTIFLNQEGKLDVKTNDITANGFILAAIILGFLFAAFVGATVFLIFKAAIMITYKDTWEKARHTQNYIQFVNTMDNDSKENTKKNKKKIDVKGMLEESSFANFMKKVPRVSAFVGHYSLNLVRKYFIDSVVEFLGFLMNPYLDSEAIKANKGIGEEKYMIMKERTLKNYYEKFCFLNGLTEKQLSDNENLKKFEEYGYELIDEDESLCKAFTKMQLLEETQDLDKSSLNSQDSLELFLKYCVKATNSDTDTEFIDEFTEKFNIFCDKYRLPRKEVRPDELTSDIKYKFGLSIISRKKLVRKIFSEDPMSKKDEKPVSIAAKLKNFGMKIVTFGRYVDKKTLQGKFLIDEDQLKYHFDILLRPYDETLYLNLDLNIKADQKKDKETERIITKKEAINKMIYHSYWYYWILMDVVMIFIQQLVTAICILPFFLLTLLQEITYSPYSIIDPVLLITKDDLMDNPWQIPGRIQFFNVWNIVIISICIFFMVYSFLDCLLYFCYSKFPEDRAFEQNNEIIQKNKVIKYLTNFQWLLIFFIVFCYASYVGLVCVWLLLGAIINPNNFLVYSTAALTFLTFLSSKYQAFQKISEDGFKMIKDQVMKIIQGQIKAIIGFMIEEVKELTSIGKDLMKSDAAKFAFDKAEALGFGEEIVALKNLTDNPDKIASGVMSALQNPNEMIEKLKKAEESLKEKAITVFKTKCKAHNIPEEMVDIFLCLNFKDQEKLKLCIAELVENKSEDVLGQKISKDLIKSILDLIIHPKTVKNNSELCTIVTQELMANIFELIIVNIIKATSKKLPEEEGKQREEAACAELKNSRKMVISFFNLMNSLKTKNTQVCVQEMKKLLKLLSFDPNEGKNAQQTLEILDIVLNMKNEAQYKNKLLVYLNDVFVDPDIFEFFAAVFFSSPDEHIQEFGKKKYYKSENIKALTQEILNDKFPVIESKKIGDITNIDFLASFTSFAIKSLKNQLDSPDIRELSDFFQKISTEIFKKEGLKAPKKDSFYKILQIAPCFMSFGKDVRNYWSSLALKYELDINFIQQIIYLISLNYWQEFTFSRIESLAEGQLVRIICNKIKMSFEDLLGFIAMFYGEFNHRYVEEFLSSLIDYEKDSLPPLFRVYSMKIVQIMFNYDQPFFINSKMAEIGIEEKFRIDFLKDQHLLDEEIKNILGINELEGGIPLKPEGEGLKEKELDGFLSHLLHLIGITEKNAENKEKNIIEFLKRLQKLFTLKKIPRSNVRRNIEIKTAVTSFAEKYKFDNDGLELLIYMMSGEYTTCIRGFKYFLEGNEEFPFKESSYKQIIKTVINEDRLFRGEYFGKFISKWLPSYEKDDPCALKDTNDQDFLAFSFRNLFWNGYDTTKFLQKLAVMSVDMSSPNKNQLIKDIRKRVFCFMNLSQLKNVGKDISELFPILKDESEGDVELKIEKSKKEECFDENELPVTYIYQAEKIVKEKISKEQRANFLNIFKNFSDLVLGEKHSFQKTYEFFFSKEIKDSKSKDLINWNEATVEKYFILFLFLNNKVHLELGEKKYTDLEQAAIDKKYVNDNPLLAKKSTFLYIADYFKKNLSLNEKEPLEFNEFNRILKYFFTTDGEVFARGLIQNFNEFHGKLNELIDIFSICSLNPSIESLNAILKINSSEIESIFNICRFFYYKNHDEKIELLQNNEKWFKKLGIDMDELILLLNFLANEIDPLDFSKFISTFSLNKSINIKILNSMYSLFCKKVANEEEFDSFIKMSEDRSVLFEAMQIDPSFGNLLCDINEGNFWNLKNIIQCDEKLSKIKIFPDNQKNPRNIMETISAFIGMISNNVKTNLKIEDMQSKFIGKSLKLGNNLETVAYLLYKQFRISPLMTFVVLNDGKAEAMAKKQNKNLLTKFKHIIKAINKMSLKEKNQIIEADFKTTIYDYCVELYYLQLISEKKTRPHFFNLVLNKQSSRTQSQTNLPNEEEQNKNAELFENKIKAYEPSSCLLRIGEIFNEKLLLVYEEEKIDEKNEDELFMAVKLNKKDDDKLFDTYAKVIKVFTDFNQLGTTAATANEFYIPRNMISCVVNLIILKEMRTIYERKNEGMVEENKGKTNKEIFKEAQRKIEQNYKDMITFGLNFDLLLTSMEKIKFLNEDYETFSEFDKNALLKFITPIFFFESIDKNNDFVLEFFFRNSLFEDDVVKDVETRMEKKKKEKSDIIMKLSMVFIESEFSDVYFSPSIDENIEKFQEYGFEKIKNYESLQILLNEKTVNFDFHPEKVNFLSNIIDWKSKNKEKYNKYRFISYEVLEDYYPESVIKAHVDISIIENECIDFESNDAETFFSIQNFVIMKNYPLFQRTLDQKKSLEFIDKLAQLFKKFQMIKGESGRDIFYHLLIIFKEKSKLSKRASKSLEFILAKISFNLKSNYNNLKMLLEFLLKSDITANDFENCLNKLDIPLFAFYGIAIPHLKMASVQRGESSSHTLANVPTFLRNIIKSESYLAKKADNLFKNEGQLKKAKSENINVNKKNEEIEEITKNQRIRNLFQKTAYSVIQKDSLVLLINCFCGDKTSWKKMLYEMNEKGFSGSREYSQHKGKQNKDFEEFLGVINLFSDSSRKPIKTPLINSRSLAELIGQSVNYTKFNSEFFEGKKLSSHDSNNLILLRGVVEHNYEILLRMFNEAPLYMSAKLNLHHNSQRYFLLKVVLLCSELANPYKQINQFILQFLQMELEENAEIISNIMGIDKDLFICFCASESGDFTHFLQYLAKKNEKYFGLLSLFCLFQLPFLSKIYDLSADAGLNYDVKHRQGISVLLMYGLFECTNEFFLPNKKDIMKDEIVKLTIDYLNKNIECIMNFVLRSIRLSAPPNPSWFALEMKDIWNKINEDFLAEIFEAKNDLNENAQNNFEENKSNQNEENKEEGNEKGENMEKKIEEKTDETKNRGKILNNISDNFAKEFLKIFELYNHFLDEYLMKNLKEEDLSMLFKFSPLLFYATSGLVRYELIDRLLVEAKDSKILENFFLTSLFKDKEKEPNEKQTEQIENYTGLIQIIMVGFEKLEKFKKDRNFDPTSQLEDIFNKMLKSQNHASVLMIQIILFVANGQSVPNKNKICQLFEILLPTIYWKITSKKNKNKPNEKERKEQENKEESNTSEEIEEKKLQETADVIDGAMYAFRDSKINPEWILDLIDEIFDFIEQYATTSLEVKKQQLQDIAKLLGKILFPSREDTQAIIESIFNFINGDFELLTPEIFELFQIDRKTFKIIKSLLEEFKAVLQGPQVYVNKKITYLASSLTGQNVSSLDIIKDKLNMEKDMDSKDLFKVFDSDKSGKISLDEFKLLSKRLNMTLSDHRIREIFTSVKGEEINYSQELNEKEFDKALNYLQEKSIFLTLEYLGITKEILFWILIWLTTLLLILFAFIFVGIAAFAIGGTFGSIINSMFPIAGGAGLGQKGEDKKSSLNMDKVKEQVEKCVEIVQSFKI